MGKFGSRSIAFRPKQSRTNPTLIRCWKGPFRFFDLPPELRDHILRLLILGWNSSHKDAIHLFLTCQRIYVEAASIFYREVLLDDMHLRGTGAPFLTGPLTKLAPRQYVRDLIIRFTMKEQLHLFGESYGAALSEMAAKGKLKYLRLEIGSRFPCSEFWGYEDELFVYDDIRLAAGKGKGTVISAPLFVTRAPFQNFLTFLDESKIPKIALFVDAEDHSKFWCRFHRIHPTGKKCDGEWKGTARLLKIYYSNLIEALRGAQATGQTQKDC
ncbi:hypothetical protein F4677DRAFT_137200 [Hypoxylon crocopeplum]|nr:hypothetical protein F4677DRAFT_137200 [Hypoxylon crocopeplum]